MGAPLPLSVLLLNPTGCRGWYAIPGEEEEEEEVD